MVKEYVGTLRRAVDAESKDGGDDAKETSSSDEDGDGTGTDGPSDDEEKTDESDAEYKGEDDDASTPTIPHGEEAKSTMSADEHLARFQAMYAAAQKEEAADFEALKGGGAAEGSRAEPKKGPR